MSGNVLVGETHYRDTGSRVSATTGGSVERDY